MSMIRLYDAQQGAKRNATTQTRLKKSDDKLCAKNKAELEKHNTVRARVASEFLTPFEVAFTQLRHIDIAELERLDTSADLNFKTPALSAVRLQAGASITALATSAAAGLGTSTVATAAVTAFATASTGTAISSLSGAAATSATLAWLGGGSVAAGGGGVAAGGMVLTALTAAPALLVAGAFLHHQGNKQLRKQLEIAAQLRQAEGELQTLSQQWAAIRSRSKAVREVLERLVGASRAHVDWLTVKVTEEADYRTFTDDERARLATLVALATTTITVMKADLFDDKMLVTSLSADVVQAASAQLDQLGSTAHGTPANA